MFTRALARVGAGVAVLAGAVALAVASPPPPPPVDWKDREQRASDHARRRLHDYRDHIDRDKHDYRVGHTTVTEHEDRRRDVRNRDVTRTDVHTFTRDWHAGRTIDLVGHVDRVNARATRLVHYDVEARQAFTRLHPGVLPAPAPAPPHGTTFDWSEKLSVAGLHHKLTSETWAVAAVEALECDYARREGQEVHASYQPLIDAVADEKRQREPLLGLACEFLLEQGTRAVKAAPETGEPAAGKDAKSGGKLRAVAWGYAAKGDGVPAPDVLKKALAQHGPLAVSVKATPHFEAYAGGVYDEKAPQGGGYANHAVLLVGWDDKKGPHGAWRVHTGFGNEWGEHGFGWVAYGAADLGREAVWVTARSHRYELPKEYDQAVTGREK